MKTILVDDEKWGLRRFETECQNSPDFEFLGYFQSAREALDFAGKHRIDLALVDIQLPDMNGLSLCDEIRKLYPDAVVIFVSAYAKYAAEALKIHKGDYYLMKPYTDEEMQDVLSRARLLSARQKKRVTIHTFGNFEIYADDRPVKFTSTKAKELLAVLVNAAGESVTPEEAFSIMWEDLPYNHTEAGRYRKALQKLQNTLRESGIDDILMYFPHARAINRSKVDCDYFDLLEEKPDAIKKFKGFYLSQYSWGEERVIPLARIKEKYDPNAMNTMFE